MTEWPRIAISWALYYIGHCFSLVFEVHDGSRWVRFWYAPYNRFMCWSVRVQGDSLRGPWGPAK